MSERAGEENGSGGVVGVANRGDVDDVEQAAVDAGRR